MAWHYLLTFDPHNLIAQLLKNPSAMQETWVQSLGWEDPLEKRKATHSSILAWRIPWTVQSTESQRVGHNRATFTFDLQGAFLCTCNLSLVPREGGVEIPLILCSNKVFPLCPCHDYYTKVFTRDQHWLFTLFLLLLPFQRANRKLIVNALIGAHLTLISRNAVSIQLEAHFYPS